MTKSSKVSKKTVRNTAAPKSRKAKNTTPPVEKIVTVEKSTGRKCLEAAAWMVLGAALTAGTTYAYNRYASHEGSN